MGKPRQHRKRSGLDRPSQIAHGGSQTIAVGRLQLREQRRELPDDVLLGHRKLRDRTLGAYLSPAHQTTTPGTGETINPNAAVDPADAIDEAPDALGICEICAALTERSGG